MVWITGYVGSGKSTISKNFLNVFEFDEIEELMLQDHVDMSKVTKDNFKCECKKYLKNTKVKIFNGIQAVDYYQKNDKVFFVKTSFLKSLIRCKKRDSKTKFKQDIKDNMILFFRLKILYLKALKNKSIICIDDLKQISENMEQL
jgi:hypothetical protein